MDKKEIQAVNTYFGTARRLIVLWEIRRKKSVIKHKSISYCSTHSAVGSTSAEEILHELEKEKLLKIEKGLEEKWETHGGKRINTRHFTVKQTSEFNQKYLQLIKDFPVGSIRLLSDFEEKLLVNMQDTYKLKESSRMTLDWQTLFENSSTPDFNPYQVVFRMEQDGILKISSISEKCKRISRETPAILQFNFEVQLLTTEPKSINNIEGQKHKAAQADVSQDNVRESEYKDFSISRDRNTGGVFCIHYKELTLRATGSLRRQHLIFLACLIESKGGECLKDTLMEETEAHRGKDKNEYAPLSRAKYRLIKAGVDCIEKTTNGYRLNC